MSKKEKKTVILVPLKTSKDKTLSQGTVTLSDWLVVITRFRGTSGKSIYSADVAMVWDRESKLHSNYILLEITEKKSSKSSRRGGVK